MILYLEGDVSHLKAKATLKPLTLHDCQSLDSNKKKSESHFHTILAYLSDRTHYT